MAGLPFAAAPSPRHVRQQARDSFLAMAVRQVLSHGATYVGAVALSRRLPADLFGLFIIVAPAWNAITALADGGIGAALVQDDREPDAEDWRTLFAVELGVLTLAALVLMVAQGRLLGAYGLHEPGPLAVLAAVLGLSALRVVPATMLERALDFRSIALADASGTLAYQAVLVSGVYAGWGLWSLAAAAVVRLAIELAILFTRRRWIAVPRPSWTRLKALAAFGLGFQGVRAMNVAKDNLPVLVVAPLLGTTAFGELQWSIVYSGVPVYLTTLVARVAFPALSRLQADPPAFADVLALALRFSVGLGLPVCLVLTLWAPDLVPVLYGPVWLTAVGTVYALLPNMVGGLVAGTMVAALNALGWIRATVWLSAAWVLATYLAALGAIRGGAGTAGVAAAFSAATVLAGVAAHALLSRRLPLRAAAWMGPALVASAPLILGGAAARQGLLAPWPCLLLASAAWLALAAATERRALTSFLRRATGKAAGA